MMVTANKRKPLQQLMKEHLLAMAGYRCALCNESLTLAETHLDHIIPLARGGVDALPNLQVAHGRCNMAKAARLAGEPSAAEREREHRAAIQQRHEAKIARWRQEREQRELTRPRQSVAMRTPVAHRPPRDLGPAGGMEESAESQAARLLAARRRLVTRNCAMCGAEFTKMSKGKYCSHACTQRAYVERRKAPPAAPRSEPATGEQQEGEDDGRQAPRVG